MKKIRVGISSKDGPILEDYEKAKSCQFCVHFMGYGLHAVAGYCNCKDMELSGGYTGGYRKAAVECDCFNCIPDMLVDDEDE